MSGEQPGEPGEQAELDDIVDGEHDALADEDEVLAGEDEVLAGEDDASGDDKNESVADGDAVATGDTVAVEETVELGVALISHIEAEECSLAAVIDRIETLTTDPAVTREILDTAELRGIIEREDGVVRVSSGSFVRFQRDVVKREGEFTCRRCGASLSTGHFIQFDAAEHGPFGSSCIKKVLGRE